MKEYLFSEKELKLIEFLKFNSPKKIWSEPIFYIFEYENFYLELGIECAEKLNLGFISENKFENTANSDLEQYVMIAKLKKINLKFKPQAGSELLTENESITEINIVRTLLFFCKYRQSSENSNFFTSESFQINPKLKIDKHLHLKHSYLVDVGLQIKINDNHLNCFILENDDDFQMNSFNQSNNLKDGEKELYEFIPLN